MDLRDQWNRLLPHAQPLGDDLLARYAEQHRHYHDQRHLTEVLRTVDELADAADDPDTVRLAAWFHDAIYDPQADPGENEEVSAQLAELELAAYGVDAAQVEEVGRLVRLTAKHDCAPDDKNGAVLCDADLRILSLPAERYDEYAAGIRQEYAHISDRDFARGRMSFLQGLAETPLYATDRGHADWEQTARANLEREIESWGPKAARPIGGLIPIVYFGAALGVVVAASVLLGRGLGAASKWPADPNEVTGFPVWAPVAGTLAATGLACAWFRRARQKLLAIPALVFAVLGVLGVGLCWWHWPAAQPGAAMSERWPYLMLASIALILAGGLLALARRLRRAPPYSQSPPQWLGVAATAVCGALLAWIVVSAGEPFVQARLETANTVSTTTTAAPTQQPVQLDGTLAWTREVPAAGAIAGTAGGVAELRSDGVVMSDANTGQIRWRYARADVNDAASRGSKGLLVSGDGRIVAANLPYAAYRAPTGIDLPTYAVLNAVSGEVLTEVHTDGRALAVDQNQLLIAEGNYVAAHGVSNPTHWRTRLRCNVTQGELMGDQAVVVDACAGNGAVVRGLDLKTGDQRWEVKLGDRFDLSAELDPETWVGDLVAVPDTREVAGLIWTASAGGTLYQWSIDVGDGRVSWSTPVPGTPRPRLGPASCDAQLAATHTSLVLITCRNATDPTQPQTYDVSAASPADGTPQWHHLLQVPPRLQQPEYARDGFALLPDGRVVTLMPQVNGSCSPVMIGTAGIQPHPILPGASAKSVARSEEVTCNKPATTVAGARPVFSDGTRLFALN
ncbi:PQQ-binding-like beta-propeller repeat protein [Kribbella sandramycini]|uniref:PQQ-binding-like beta-propeller repeat protein n=1 Tax=Kribbella sandramycini TaxID=60450 RepID=A0A7Y4P1J5_9ACTN|nr:HD domain-containing protein [Kribbella sandramycini]MBB6564480.1 putative metal-dependent HD superfamily phosphohydrolase/outer membrane protein assembly factor BamB [Kribbella sandramycini]NOL42184.1 PQQ-binding-like beta-propeller repeat protein [Kribbella sandramycini]